MPPATQGPSTDIRTDDNHQSCKKPAEWNCRPESRHERERFFSYRRYVSSTGHFDCYIDPTASYLQGIVTSQEVLLGPTEILIDHQILWIPKLDFSFCAYLLLPHRGCVSRRYASIVVVWVISRPSGRFSLLRLPVRVSQVVQVGGYSGRFPLARAMCLFAF